MDIGHARLNVALKLELLTTLADFDRAQLARPIVDILKKMMMDCPKMFEVERALGYTTSCSLNDKAALNPIQSIDIGDPKTISEYGGAGMNVRVFGLNHFDAA